MKGGLGKVMLSIVLSLRVLGEDGATRDGVIMGGSSANSSPDSRGPTITTQVNIKLRRTKRKVGLM